MGLAKNIIKLSEKLGGYTTLDIKVCQHDGLSIQIYNSVSGIKTVYSLERAEQYMTELLNRDCKSIKSDKAKQAIKSKQDEIEALKADVIVEEI